MQTPLDYQPPLARPSRRLFSFDAFFAMAGVTGVCAFVCLTAVPRLLVLFKDFSLKLPAATDALFYAVKAAGPGGVIGAAALASLLAGALGAAADAPPEADRETFRRRRRGVRRLFFGVLLMGGVTVALALPYTQLIEGLSSGRVK